MDTLKIINSILQFISVLITAVLGITNLLIDYKDKDGNVTKGGNRALTAIVISSIISIVTFGLELIIKNKEEDIASRKTLEIVQGIEKTINPIKDVEASFFVFVNFDKSNELRRYKERLRKGMQKIVYSLGKNKDTIIDGVSVSSWDEQNKIEIVEISSGSSLFPDYKRETLAFNVINNQIGQLYFFKRAISIDSFITSLEKPVIDTNYRKADLRMYFEPSDRLSQILIHYNLQTDEIQAVAFNIKSDSRYWNSNGNIISIPDLSKAQLLIVFQNADAIKKLSSLFLTMTDGRQISIGTKMEEYMSGKRKVYEYIFPEKLTYLQ